MRRFAIVSFLVLLAARICSADGPANTQEQFRKMQGLAGSWKLVDPKSDSQTAFRISYKVISRGSALVETFGDPARDVTETIYHLDGTHLIATHYCAQGNQPRLRLQPDSSDTMLHFSFLDVTNLKRPEDSHLIDLKFTFLSDGRIQREETYIDEGKKDVSTLTLRRDPA